MARKRGNASKNSRDKILNAFDTAVDDDYYIKGLRHQQDIDLDHISDERIRQLLSNQVDPENDEEIDSDEAMGSASDISLGEPGSENEDEWGDSYDESELLPLSEIWDLDTKEQEEAENSDGSEETSPKATKATKSSKAKVSPKDKNVKHGLEAKSDDESQSESGSESDSASESGSEEGSESELESGSESESAELDLDNMSDSSDEEASDETLLNAIKNVSGADDIGPSSHRLTDAGEENPFSLPGASGSKELSLQEVIPGTQEGRTLSVPAPQRIQERADRSAALDLAKKELGKWTDTIAANRQAEHLQFPINAPPELQAASPFNITAQEEQNSLEQQVSNILQTSALADEKAVSTFEEMAPSTLSVEEVRKRRDELRYMRELMYREEQRAKRIKKIKSKSYRKVHKRERERMQELEGDEDDEESVDKAERARALERATLRHRASSKWAKRMADQGLTRDAGTRSEIEEMLRQGDALKQKIRGSFESDEESDGNSDTERMRLEDESQDKAPEKGVLSMKFMREADERERTANEKRLRDDYSDDASEEENVGRKSFNPAGQALKRDLAAREQAGESDEDEERDITVKKTAQKRRNKKDNRQIGEEVVEIRRRDDSDEDEGEREEPEKLSHDITYAQRNKEQKEHKGPQSAKKVQQPAQTSTIESNPWLVASANASTPGTMKLAKSSSKQADSGKQNKNSKTILVENTLGDTMVREKDMTLQQQDLVREAFAGDDVVAEFEAEKRREADEDGDQEIDETLPGWGTWSSEKPRVQKVRKVTGIKPSERKDFRKGNVIINEKTNKKSAKFNASAVPFPFENKQQYERSLRMPIGQEWATKDTFQRQTKPRVLVKRGSVIDPIKKPMSN